VQLDVRFDDDEADEGEPAGSVSAGVA